MVVRPTITADFSDLIIVVVGRDKKHFRVNRSSLTKSSSFFQACLKPGWHEGQSKTVHLPAVSPHIFEFYMEWLYTGEISDLETFPAEKLDHHLQGELANCRNPSLARLGVLADILGEPALHNKIVDIFLLNLEKLSRGPSVRVVNFLWAKLPANSPLRAFLIDLFATWVVYEKLQEKAIMPIDFMFEVAMSLRKDNKKEVPSYSKRCRYHKHGDGIPPCPVRRVRQYIPPHLVRRPRDYQTASD